MSKTNTLEIHIFKYFLILLTNLRALAIVLGWNSVRVIFAFQGTSGNVWKLLVVGRKGCSLNLVGRRLRCC